MDGTRKKYEKGKNMKDLKKRPSKTLMVCMFSLSMFFSTSSAVDAVLTDTQIHAVLGVVTNFILDDEQKTYKPPKKTGQTQSYNAVGLLVADGSVKDDGFYQKGIASNYSRDAGNEIVTDHLTGLQWQDDVAVSTVKKRWITFANNTAPYSNTSGDTATTYCANLPLGGYSDWRLPTRKELLGISLQGQTSPTIDSVFQNVIQNTYWSSTSSVGYNFRAWHVDFSFGKQAETPKTNPTYVRCVRAGDTSAPADFTKNANIVTDNITGLQWQDDALVTATWLSAIQSCENLSLDGFNDWRLPNIKELSTLVDDNRSLPAIDTTFQNTSSNNYWSSTTSLGDTSRARLVSFDSGFHTPSIKSTSFNVRCVRAGH